MFQHSLKTAFRSLWRNKQSTIINMAGLALGIAVFLLITQYLAWEWGANRFNRSYNSLYRVNVQYATGAADHYLPPGFAPVLKQQFPAVERSIRVSDGIGNGTLRFQSGTASEEKALKGSSILYADNDFLEVFSFPVLQGTAVLPGPKTLAMSETMATKLFGKEDAIGKTVTVSNQFGNTPYTVASVYRQPVQSDIQADVLLSLQTLENAANRDGNDWADPNTLESGFTNIYVKLVNGTKATSLADNITQYVRSINPGSKTDVVYLQPFSELHLAPSFSYPFQTYGSLAFFLVFAAIALLILLIAWVNYINLSVAQSLNRAKEIGVRKVLGANRQQLMRQYLSETFLLTLISTALAVLIVDGLQDWFNLSINKPLSLGVLTNSWFLFFAVALVVGGSLLAGSYTGIVLTNAKPVTALHHKKAEGAKGMSLRKALVVFQFTISIVLIIATVVIFKQLRFMKTENLGMNLDQLMVIAGPTVSSEEQAETNVAFKNSLAQLPFVKKQAASNNVPGVGFNFTANGITSTNPQKGDEQKGYAMFICDQNFFDTYGISFAQGKAFSQNDAERSWNNVKKVIINQKAARQLGLDPAQDLVGKKIIWGDPYEVIGVVKDYHHLSLREEIKPTIYLGSVSYSYYTVLIDATNFPTKLETIKKIYRQAFPGNPFEYFFSDEKFNQQYLSEQRLGSLFVAAACIAIFIACLGLFGLAAFLARQRTKEIGIRKVLGASVADIASLLSTDFIRLALVAFFVASPVSWWLTQQWLQDFAYRTPVSIWIFLAAGLAVIFIVLATVSLLAIRAAKANPVKSLRTE